MKELTEALMKRLPDASEEVIQTVMRDYAQIIHDSLINGQGLVVDNEITFILKGSEMEKQVSPDDGTFHVSVEILPPSAPGPDRKAALEHVPAVHQTPTILTARDMILRLDNVLDPNGILQLNGMDLAFDRYKDEGECVIEGTRSGRAVQTGLAGGSYAEVMMRPQVPAQTRPWNNEYRVLLSTRCPERGDLHTGTYGRFLRTPLAVVLGRGDGILSGSGDAPLVTVGTGGLNEESVRVRVQAVSDTLTGGLLLNLIGIPKTRCTDPRCEGTGAEVPVCREGAYTLPGFGDSPLRSLEIILHDYAALEEMVRTAYAGRVADILDIRPAD